MDYCILGGKELEDFWQFLETIGKCAGFRAIGSGCGELVVIVVFLVGLEILGIKEFIVIVLFSMDLFKVFLRRWMLLWRGDLSLWRLSLNLLLLDSMVVFVLRVGWMYTSMLLTVYTFNFYL